MFRKNVLEETAIKLAAIALILTSGITLLMPSIIKASAQPTVTEVSAPGIKPNEYYLFTQELNAEEEKLGVPVAVFTLTNIIVHKGDTVTIHFINTADEKTDRHTFTMQSPYKMNHDMAGGENTTFTFKADTVGGFTYYCTYDLPSMIGHLEVLP
ncbi:MAG TPA: cupredoxin domain-containing protein [Nitrososphaeraceae archaeon]